MENERKSEKHLEENSELSESSANSSKKKSSWFIKLIKFLFEIFLFTSFAVVGFGMAFMYVLSRDLPKLKFTEWRPVLNSTIYDCNGKVITQLRARQNRREWVSADRIPKYMKDAIVAIEDERFYQHHGIDPIGILRAIVVDILSGRIKQGASTITQQLARNAFLTLDRTFIRKLKELIIAFELERKYTKDEILEMYLNTVYFGHGAWGIASAAYTYFGKRVEDLTLAECALLAALPQAPSRYDPFKEKGRKLARKRQLRVLDKMVELGFITPQEAEAAKLEVIKLRHTEKNYDWRGYFVDEVVKWLVKRYGWVKVFTGGLKIYTTLDLDWQLKAGQIVKNYGIEAVNEWPRWQRKYYPLYGWATDEALQAACMVIDVKSGAIRVMVGGKDYSITQFNRCTQSFRHVGSSFKPIVYLTALLNGYTEATIVNDRPFVWENKDTGQIWMPKNFANKYMGPVPLKVALAASLNSVAAQLAVDLGVNKIIKVARKLGIKGKLNRGPAIALGASDLQMIDMARVYTTLANEGERVELYMVEKVVDSDGEVLYQHDVKRKRVIPAPYVYVLIDMMKAVVQRGTGRRAYFGRPVAGKTGTTNEGRDTWFCGFSPQYVGLVWVGRDDYKPLGKRFASAGKIAAPLWRCIMKMVHESVPATDFPIPNGIVFANICKRSGKLATKYCKETLRMAFVAGTEPKEMCDLDAPTHEDPYETLSLWELKEEQFKEHYKEADWSDE